MYDIIFYKDSKGIEPVKEYILSLFCNDSKENRMRRNKIQDYIGILEEHGTRAGIPFVKPLGDGIWELRPMDDRVLFFTYVNGKIILLSHFRKKTRKTPRREIEKAQRLREDYIRRNKDNEKKK